MGEHKRCWLIKTRTSLGLTQKDVAERAKITRSYYTRIECGEYSVPIETAKKIAAVLGFDWQRFYDESPQNNTPEA